MFRPLLLGSINLLQLCQPVVEARNRAFVKVSRVRNIAAKDALVLPRAKSLERPSCTVRKRWSGHRILVFFDVRRPWFPPGEVLDHPVDLWEREVSQIMNGVNSLIIKQFARGSVKPQAGETSSEGFVLCHGGKRLGKVVTRYLWVCSKFRKLWVPTLEIISSGMSRKQYNSYVDTRFQSRQDT